MLDPFPFYSLLVVGFCGLSIFFPLFGCWECVGKENVMEFCILSSGHH